jgi:hypothetical protein
VNDRELMIVITNKVDEGAPLIWAERYLKGASNDSLTIEVVVRKGDLSSSSDQLICTPKSK